MINRLYIYESRDFSPYHNLAVEQYLLETLKKGDMILYLWQNQNTVVIGRNQNAYRECRCGLLESEGGCLARRLSGGGAVYHDLGNLNFTFLTDDDNYDLSRQHEVICRACRSIGIPATISGRNDITVQGRKVSGNAFYRHNKRACHHGTLLVNVDMERMGRYLSPSRAKLRARSVDSVRSRVANLSEFVPGLGCGELSERLKQSFEEVYALDSGSDDYKPPVIMMDEKSFDRSRIYDLTGHFRSREWVYGADTQLAVSLEERYAWGDIELEMEINGSTVAGARVYTDAMDWRFPAQLAEALTGCSFDAESMRKNILAAMDTGDNSRYAGGTCQSGSGTRPDRDANATGSLCTEKEILHDILGLIDRIGI